MDSGDGDFTNPVARAGGRVPRAVPEHASLAGTAIGFAILLVIAAAFCWSAFSDWNLAPEVPLEAGPRFISFGRILAPAAVVTLLLALALALADVPASRGPRALWIGLFIALAAAFAALEASGELRRLALKTFGSVPGGFTRLQTFEHGKGQMAQTFASNAGEPQGADFFAGAWRRQEHLLRNDVRRVVVRVAGGELFVRVWYECNPGAPACDAGEVPAAVATRAGGIESLSAELPIPDGRIWLRMGSGRYQWQPAIIVTQIYLAERPEWQVSSAMAASLLREKPAVPLAEFVGDWSGPPPRDLGGLTRMSVRAVGPNALMLRAWSRCEAQRECDLGEQRASIDTGPDGQAREVKAVFSSGNRRLTLILDPPYQGRFEAGIENTLLQSRTVQTRRRTYTEVYGSNSSRTRIVLTRGHPADPLAGAPGVAPTGAAASRAVPPGPTATLAASCTEAQTLHAAAALGCTDRLRALMLVQPNALEARDALGQTALAAAVLRNRRETAEFLLKSGADANAAIRFADAQRPNASGLQRAQRPELADGSTPLILAQDEAMATLLLRFGADVKPRNSYGWSALFYYVHHGTVPMVEALLAAGADINDTANVDPSHAGSTPLMWAAYMNRTAHLEALLRHRPRLDLRDRAGKTALDYARGFGHQDAVRLLTAARP